MKQELEKLIEKYNKQWNKYGMGSVVAYSKVVADLEKLKEIEKHLIAQAFEDGEHNYFYSKKTGKDFENGIEYYNEKFKQQ
jgi:ribosomal protein S24E